MGKNSSFKITWRNPMEIWKERTEASMLEAMEHLQDYTANQMLGPKTGRWYTKDGITWRASAPDEYPAVWKANLLREVSSRSNIKIWWQGMTVYGQVVVEDPTVTRYAIDILEAGLRPWKNRALIECGPAIENILGPKLVAGLNGEMSSARWKTRWDNYR